MSKDKPTLADYAVAVEAVCDEIEDIDGPIPEGVIAKFSGANLALQQKVDNWIGYLDAVASRLELLKDQRKRITKAIQTGENFQRGLRDYLKMCLLQFSEGEGKRVPLIGSAGKLYLHNNPVSVKISYERKDKTIYRCMEKETVELDESLWPYIIRTTVYTLDTDLIKADLEQGTSIPWASIEQDCHVRVKG